MMVWAMRLGSVVGFLSGSAVVAVNSLPVPDDLKSWPVQAILGLVAVTAIGVACVTMRQGFKQADRSLAVIEKQAEATGQMHEAQRAATEAQRETTEAQRETSAKLDLLCAKIDILKDRIPRE